mmetsp:Transcript_24795/g.68348  ORF Transcript_24795/g.68348 Transcript_24795/m.68348 type:complete len:419 (+) Transcript_24795:219-1475(+)
MQDLWKANEERNLAPLTVPGAASAGSVRVVSGSGFRYVIPFPYRLHEMLSTVDTQHDSSIVSWLPDGKHFKVHDPRRFVESVIPSAFKQKSLKSFQRQLHLYGFQRVHEGPDKGAYYHEKFLRDDRDLCLTITRAKAPKRSRAASAKTSKDTIKRPAKLPTFHSSTKGMESSSEFSNLITQPRRIMATPAVSITPSIFDEDSLPDQSIPMIESSYGTRRGPLHEATTNPPVPSNCSSAPQPDPHRAYTSQYNNTQQVTYNQQGRNNQQLEGSVVETCQWLINAGVPMSAFDPVAINEITDYTPLSVPELVPSPVVPQVPQNPTIPKTVITNVQMVNTQSTTDGNAHGGEQQLLSNATNNNKQYQQSSAHRLGFPAHNLSLSTLSTFHGGDELFDTDQLVTDLLPGEDLPLVDDSLWAL